MKSRISIAREGRYRGKQKPKPTGISTIAWLDYRVRGLEGLGKCPSQFEDVENEDEDNSEGGKNIHNSIRQYLESSRRRD